MHSDSSSLLINECVNLAKINGTDYVGEIVGVNQYNSTVQGCYNTGIIKKSETVASKDIGTSSNHLGYLIGRYGLLTGQYGNTTQEIMSGWNNATIATNLSSAFIPDVKNSDGTWKYNDGYPILS